MGNIQLPTELPGFNILYEHIFNSALKQRSVDQFWKDKNGRYLGVNRAFLDYAGLQSFEDVIGKTDHNFGWSKSASTMKNNDMEVINIGHSRKFLESCKVGNKIELFFNNKRPLRSRTGKIIGVYGTSIPLNNDQTSGFNPDMNDLTQRQIECLFYLTQGKTAQEIGHILHRSRRTIEKNLDVLKMKWDCNSKSQLIAKALSYIESFESTLL